MARQAEPHEPPSPPPLPPARPVTVAYARPGPRRRTNLLGLVLALGLLLVLLSFAVGIQLPGMSRARSLFREAVCGANLNATGKAVLLYQVESEDMAPPALGTLVTSGLVTPMDLACPASGTVPPASDYIYAPLPADVGGGLIRAFELPANHRQQSASVLYAAGNTQSTRDTSALLSDLQALNNYLAEQRAAGGGAR